MLNQITIPEEAVRAALENDPDYEFAEFENQEWGDGFDYALLEVARVLNSLLENWPANVTLGGVRPNPADPTLTVDPHESIDATLVADTTPVVNGYLFTYDVWGARRLSLASSFYEWKDMRPEADGIDGCVEVAYNILAAVNYSIRNADEFITALV